VIDLGIWASELEKDCKSKKMPIQVDQRVIIPGQNSLQSEGLVRFQAIGPIHRPGNPPEAMSVISWGLPSKFTKNRVAQEHIATLLGALMTFLLDRRVEVLNEYAIKAEDRPETVFLPSWDIYDRRLAQKIEGQDLHQGIRTALGLILPMNRKQQRAISAALEMHYWSCHLLAGDLRTSYTLAVGAIELLSRAFGNPPEDWNDWNESTSWNEHMESIGLSEDQKEKIKEKLMQGNHLALQETFTQYASSRLPEEFFDRKWPTYIADFDLEKGIIKGYIASEDEVKVRDLIPGGREELKVALKKSYSARSNWIHAGKHGIEFIEAVHYPRRKGDKAKPLPFAILREILTCLITEEMVAQKDSFHDLIDLQYIFD
jgi:hypothetical protein